MSLHEKPDMIGSFPSDFIDPKIKETKEIGLLYARAVFNGYNSSATQTELNTINENRAYAEGTYDVTKFQNQLNEGEDITSLNLDYTPVPIISKFVDILVGNFSNQSYDIVTKAIDSRSKIEKDKYRKDLLKKMLLRDEFDEPLREASNNSMFLVPENEELPEDKEDLEIHMSLTYKQDLEIAMEKAIEFVMENNDFEGIEKRLIRDLIENKKCSIRLYYDGNNAIRLRYVDIGAFVHTQTSDPQFMDSTYFGEVIYMTIQDIRRMNPDMDLQELFNIAKKCAGKYGNRTWSYGEFYQQGNGYDFDWDDFRVEVLDFYVKSIDFKNFEKKETNSGNFFINEKDHTYKEPKKSKNKRQKLSKEVEVSYEGLWVTGTNTLITYGRSKNMVSPVKNGEYMPTLLPQFIVMSPGLREGLNRSLVSRMIPHSDSMMLCQLNIQNILANSAPPGLSIDVSAMSDLKVSSTKNLEPLELIKLYRQTGVIIYDGMTAEGQIRQQRPIESLPGGVSDSIIQYLNLYQSELENIRQITGINQATDASTPQKNALIGVQKLAIQQSNNATRELQEGFVNILKRSGLTISRMIQDLAKFGGDVTPFASAIGDYPAELLGLHKDKTLAEYGIFVKAQPTEEERHELNISIQKAVELGAINIADELKLKDIHNIKEAEAYLRRAIVKNQTDRAEAEQASYQAKAQADAQASQIATESKIMLEQAKAQAEIEVENIKAQNKAMLEQQAFEREKERMELANLHKLEQIRASLVMGEEFGVNKTNVNDGKKKGSLTKVSPSPPTKITPPQTMSAPSKIRESGI